METELGFSLSKEICTDLFHLDVELHGGVTKSGFLRCRLDKCLLDPTYTVSATLCDEWGGEYEALPSTEYLVDYERGTVMLPLSEGENRWAKIVYRAGWSTPQEVDYRVKQGLVLYTLQALQVSAQKGPDSATSGAKVPQQQEFASLLLERVRRVEALVFYPLHRTRAPA